MTDKLHRILQSVQKPARYVGGEYNEIIKDKREVDVRVAFCFPDTYEIGMSNIGMRILYDVMNKLPGVWCERVFAPWGDMEKALREHDIPLYALESKDPVRDFDLIAFTLGYEMSYTNVLNMLELAGVPKLASEREGLHNLVFAGGVCTVNPEPLADFIDFFSIGEGEEMTPEILTLYRTAKREGWTKAEFLREVCKIGGVYVPSLYRHSYNPDGTLAAIEPLEGAPARVTKRVIENMDKSDWPEHAIVPSTEIVHDRSNLEVFRGCIRGCRFCQAGFCYRPVREKRAETLLRQAIQSLEDSGNSEITLASLSTSDYTQLAQLAEPLLDYCQPRKISLSLPSLRADNFSRELMLKVQKVKKTGLTFAPEAGTQRLRDAINKNVTEEEILQTCATAFSGGWSSVKLYFMLGLPTETDEDVLGIAELAQKIVHVWRENAANKKAGAVHQPRHGVFCAQALYAVSVGGADHAGGISAAGASAEKRAQLPRHRLPLSRIRPQPFGGGARARRPAAWKSSAGGAETRRAAGRLGRIFSLSDVAGCVCCLRRRSGSLHRARLRRG